MKLICDCGNEMEFEESMDRVDDEYGLYVKTDYDKFDKFAIHDQAGFTCKKCDKAIWLFA